MLIFIALCQCVCVCSSKTVYLFSPLVPPCDLFTGSVGDAISVMTPDVYVSDDGGYSWQKALSGPHHYAILDSGGLLVAVEQSNEAISAIK